MANEGSPANPSLSGAQILAKLLALGALGAAFSDDVFAIKGSADATKIARFEVDGLTTATTRVYTLPDASITVAGINLAQTFSATQTFAGIDATSIGATTRGTGLFTTLGANGATTLTSTLAVTGLATLTGGLTTPAQITSTIATGTAPLVIASTTAVANLNASLLLGNTWAAPGAIGGTTPGSAAHTTISASGQITSTVATGTAPLVIASTTVVGNLNVSQLLGSTWAAPGSIGSGTPAAGAFTTLAASGAATLSSTLAVSGAATIDLGTGADPATGLSGTVVTLRNADATNVRLLGVAYGANGLILSGRGVGGTRALPTATTSGQVLCQFTGFGYNGTTYPTASSALYAISAGSLWTASNQETLHEWRCTPNGSTTNTQRMVLYGTGNLCLGSSPADDGVHNLQVAGSAIVSGAMTLSSTLGVTGVLTASGTAAISSTTSAPLTVSSNQAGVSPSLNNTAAGNVANNIGWEYYLGNGSNASTLFSYLTVGSSTITAGSETATINFGAREAGTNYNVLSFVGRAASILGNTTIGPGSGSATSSSVLKLQNSSAGVALQFFTNNGSIYNWVISSNLVLSNALEFIPSTAASGVSFTTSAFTIYATGSVTIGPRAALATNATAGFVYMPTCAGTPTGVPTAETGKVPWVYDTTNNIIYVYNGAWKKTAALT